MDMLFQLIIIIKKKYLNIAKRLLIKVMQFIRVYYACLLNNGDGAPNNVEYIKYFKITADKGDVNKYYKKNN